MKIKNRNLRDLAEMIIGDPPYGNCFQYRTSSKITRFFEECDLDFTHDGSTRWSWTVERLEELLQDPQPGPNLLPDRFVRVFQVLMDKSDAVDGDNERNKALEHLNKPLNREGYEAFYGDDGHLYFRHIRTQSVTASPNPHRPFTTEEIKKRELLCRFLDSCSEDDLIEQILLPLFRQLGYHRIFSAGHKDKALEYGKDVWMRFILPTQHVLYFGLQAKKGKLDASGVSKSSNANVAEIHNQALMMLGHEVFDPETSKKVLVDHAFIVAGGEITKQARNWLGGKLDASKRSQILFMDRDDILNLYTVSNLPLPAAAAPVVASFDDIPF